MRTALVVALLLAVSTPARAEPVSPEDRATLRARLSEVPREDPRYARARFLLGALELGDDRPLAAAAALEQSLAAGARPRDAALALLVWSWAGAGDRARMLSALARWPGAPPELVRRLAGPFVQAEGSLAAGYDTNVRLDTEATTSGAGVSAAWASAAASVTLRPLARRDRLALQLALDQRVHLTHRDEAALYDVGRGTLGVAWDQGLAAEALHLRVDAWAQETFGDDLAKHLEHAAGADARLGLHPPGRWEAGLWLSAAARDLDGGGLGDRSLDAQDGARLVAGAYADLALPGRSAGELALRTGARFDLARDDAWDAIGTETHIAVALRPGPLELALDGSWSARAFEARIEHRLGASVEAGLPVGSLRPFARATAERNATTSPQSYTRAIVAGGVAVTLR